MKQTTCPDCGAVYAVSEPSCPTCGCPNDHCQPQQEQQPVETNQSQKANQTGNANLNKEANQSKEAEQTTEVSQASSQSADDFNEGERYSPFSSTSWFLSTPWPLSHYPERKGFDEAHPFWGWLFGPWHLSCKSEAEAEEYAVINNFFYLCNLLFKTLFYAALWSFFKGFFIWIAFYLFQLFFVGMAYKAATIDAVNTLLLVSNVIAIPFSLLFLIITSCGMGRALHRYWPSIHQTWRRMNKRYWTSMRHN